MHSFNSSTPVVTTLLTILSLCQALELQEIRPWGSRIRGSNRIGKRDMSVFELKSTETFLWGAQDGSDATLGNLTVFMPGDNENILSMEKFDGMLTSAECNAQGMTLGFEDDSSFAYAQGVWDWVNGAENHTFLMVAGKGDCGNNTYRIPYLVHSIEYDEERNIARLNATKGEWKDLVHSYELRVGSVPMSSDLGLTRRDWNQDASMDMSADLQFRTKLKTGPVSGDLVCYPCYTAGKMKFEFVIKTKFQIPVGLKFRLNPQGVKASAALSLNVASDFNSKTEAFKESIGKIPLAGISIPGGILTVGPVLDIQLGGEVTGFEGTVSIKTGATATLPETAVLQADLLDPSNNEFSSWTPAIKTDDFTMQAKVSASIKLFLEPALKLQAEALGQGIETGIGLKMPYVEAKAEAIVSQGGGACEKGDQYEGALKLRPAWGFEIKFQAGKIGGKQPVDVTLGSASMPIGKPLCIPWDIEKAGSPSSPSGSSSLPVPATSPSTIDPKPTPSGGSPGGNSCTVKTTGKTGTCTTTAQCKSSGGISTPGYCPNDPSDVQCCTSTPQEPPKPGPSNSSNTCTVAATGLTGECISTSSCSLLGGKSTAGLCPGAANIQCCTYDSCRVGAKSGQCIPTGTCKGTSTPGLCKGGDNIQCCT